MDTQQEFIEYVLYLANNTPNLTLTKLYKLLWFANIEYADTYGEIMIKDVFLRKQFWPVPQMWKDYLDTIRESETQEDENIKLEFSTYNQYSYIHLIPKRKPNPDYFTDADISVLNNVIKIYGSKSAKELSVISHDQAWNNAIEHAKIDISTDMKNSKFKDAILDQYDDIVFMTQMRIYA